ncbi:MAG: Jag N-terminal domain-containing protein [Anaerolineae bacterium]|nr:Jag N-terminal domain-containing protein [Anaerolineae bacterium]
MASDESVVVSAPSVEEAIIIGLTRLTATREEVDIEVLDEGTKGFLGIGSRAAQVRLTRRLKGADVTPVTPLLRPAETRAPVAEATGTPEVDQGRAPETTMPAPSSTPPELATVKEKAAATAAAQQAAPAVAESVASEPSISEQPEPVRPRAEAQKAEPRQRAADGLDRSRIAAVAQDIVDNLLQGLSVESTIEWIDEDRPTLWVSIGGRDADNLVGPRARNLHDLQYLFRALIYHKADGNYNVVVDADGYRRRRRRSLESMAQKKANQAVEQGQTVRLRPMPAHERRIIHIALREDARVTTESVGRGRDRAVTIIPLGTTPAHHGS